MLVTLSMQGKASQQMQSTGTEGTLAVTAPSFVPAAEQE